MHFSQALHVKYISLIGQLTGNMGFLYVTNVGPILTHTKKGITRIVHSS